MIIDVFNDGYRSFMVGCTPGRKFAAETGIEESSVRSEVLLAVAVQVESDFV